MKELNYETLNNLKNEILLLDKISAYKYEKKSKSVNMIFEKLMAKLGWYRKTTVYLIDLSKIKII